MADAPKQPTVAELKEQLTKKQADWIARFGGQPNHNPHIQAAKLIRPLLDKLSVKDAKADESLLKAIAALPKDSPVLDNNWKPEVEPTVKVVPTAKTHGAQNAQA